MNLSTLRNSIKILQDPSNPQKQIIEIDYKFSTNPFIAYRKELSNHSHAKSASLALYRRLKKKNLLEAFHAKMTEGMLSHHSMYMTEEKSAELDKFPRYFCTLNYVQKNSTSEKKVRPTSNFSAHTSQTALIFSL